MNYTVIKQILNTNFYHFLYNDPSLDCDNQSKKPIFSDGFKTYQFYLPNYSKQSSNGAKYRVFAIFHNTKDSNNYYSYATIEVNR